MGPKRGIEDRRIRSSRDDGTQAEAPAGTETESQNLRLHILLPVHPCHQFRGLDLSQRSDLHTVAQVRIKANRVTTRDRGKTPRSTDLPISTRARDLYTVKKNFSFRSPRDTSAFNRRTSR